MSKQNLNHPDIDILLQQMGGKAMPQRMRRNAFVDTREPGSHVADAVQLACGQRVDRVPAWKQPALRPADAVPLAQNIEQHRGEHGKAVLAALALFHA